MEGRRVSKRAILVRDGQNEYITLDTSPPIIPKPKGWWIGTDFGPDGNYSQKGPVDDDKRRVLVISREGFSKERYLNDDVAEFIMEARNVQESDIWVDLDPTPYSCDLKLCKQDTPLEIREKLVAKGFKYLGSRDDLVFFTEPEKPIIKHNEREYPTSGVKIRIVRGKCFCSSYHKNPYPGTFDYSQVALYGEFGPPPLQEIGNCDREVEEYQKELQEKAESGDERAKFLLTMFHVEADYMRLEKQIVEDVMKKVQTKYHVLKDVKYEDLFDIK
jgi:hypothetical protein